MLIAPRNPIRRCGQMGALSGDPIGRSTAANMFRLLAEQHGKTVHLFDGSPEATWGRGKCFSTKYAPVSRSSPAGHKLLNAEVNPAPRRAPPRPFS